MIPPLAGGESLNLGQTFLANSVQYKQPLHHFILKFFQERTTEMGGHCVPVLLLLPQLSFSTNVCLMNNEQLTSTYYRDIIVLRTHMAENII